MEADIQNTKALIQEAVKSEELFTQNHQNIIQDISLFSNKKDLKQIKSVILNILQNEDKVTDPGIKIRGLRLLIKLMESNPKGKLQ